MTEVRIIGFDKAYAKAFADLNYQWIGESYGVEKHDREMLDSPAEHIIDRGGEIFFALIDGTAVGTVALIPFGEGSLELAKMAVSPSHRGAGIGDKLMRACVEHAERSGARSIILESNTRQEAAIRLYRRHGFHEIPLDPNSQYARANIRMELAISPPNM